MALNWWIVSGRCSLVSCDLNITLLRLDRPHSCRVRWCTQVCRQEKREEMKVVGVIYSFYYHSTALLIPVFVSGSTKVRLLHTTLLPSFELLLGTWLIFNHVAISEMSHLLLLPGGVLLLLLLHPINMINASYKRSWILVIEAETVLSINVKDIYITILAPSEEMEVRQMTLTHFHCYLLTMMSCTMIFRTNHT